MISSSKVNARVWVGVALGLPGAARQSETELALLDHVTRQDFSKGVTKFLRIAQLPPALGIKSDAAKASFRNRQLDARG
jgi:hypothetical protein